MLNRQENTDALDKKSSGIEHNFDVRHKQLKYARDLSVSIHHTCMRTYVHTYACTVTYANAHLFITSHTIRRWNSCEGRISIRLLARSATRRVSVQGGSWASYQGKSEKA